MSQTKINPHRNHSPPSTSAPSVPIYAVLVGGKATGQGADSHGRRPPPLLQFALAADSCVRAPQVEATMRRKAGQHWDASRLARRMARRRQHEASADSHLEVWIREAGAALSGCCARCVPGWTRKRRRRPGWVCTRVSRDYLQLRAGYHDFNMWSNGRQTQWRTSACGRRKAIDCN